MKTEDIIRRLSRDLRPLSPRRFYLSALLAAVLGTAGLLALSYLIFPARSDLSFRLFTFRFSGETILCLLSFFVSATLAYRSAVPGLMRTRQQVWGTGIFLLLLAVILFKVSPQFSDWKGEMDFYRGRCGPLIFILGSLEGALFVILARWGAPTNPALTGAWIAAAGGALGLFVMQFVCPFENFPHLLIWHALPCLLLLGVGLKAGPRLLRW